MCDGSGVARCAAGEDGCRAWVPEGPCPEGQVCSDGVCTAGVGFAREAAAWAVPVGGRAGEGFAAPTGQAAAVGDDDWTLLDLDGDGALDLVRTAAAYPAGDGFTTRTKGFPLAPFWAVHRGGGGDGFAAAPSAWSLPVGVGFAGRGLVAAAGEPVEVGDLVWALRDVDGDGRPDLVVTGVRASESEVVPLGWPDAPRWDVYSSDGSRFAAEPQAWALPPGNDAEFFHHVDGAPLAPNAPAWSLLDLDGDGWSDLVVSGRVSGQRLVSPGFPDSPFWEVHRGGATGFDAPLTVWSLPPGGGAKTGFAGLTGVAEAAGDQEWAVLDLDGDRRLELVVTGQLDDLAAGPAALTREGAPAGPCIRPARPASSCPRGQSRSRPRAAAPASAATTRSAAARTAPAARAPRTTPPAGSCSTSTATAGSTSWSPTLRGRSPAACTSARRSAAPRRTGTCTGDRFRLRRRDPLADPERRLPRPRLPVGPRPDRGAAERGHGAVAHRRPRRRRPPRAGGHRPGRAQRRRRPVELARARPGREAAALAHLLAGAAVVACTAWYPKNSSMRSRAARSRPSSRH
ncbi:FG-GAP repeat domain-containing protein [Nannocystis pusilla]|uniref:FG-GAP repeat domain-containing protein n=1 Tax=Nannocystis pusilla TaxID=889268 RepID=UPI003B7C9E6B